MLNVPISSPFSSTAYLGHMKQTTLLMLLSTFMLWGCSVQKRTTQPGWHVESAWFNSTPTAHIQSQVTPSATPLSLRRASTLASTQSHREGLHLPKRTHGQPDPQLPPTTSKLHSGIVEAQVNKRPRLQRRLLEGIHIQPNHTQADYGIQSQPTGQEGEPNGWIHIGIGLAVLGIFLMPSPLALLGIGLSTFAFIIGVLRGPKNAPAPAPSPAAEPKRRRPLLKVFLLIAGMTLATILIIVAMISDATSGWSNPFEGWTIISW